MGEIKRYNKIDKYAAPQALAELERAMGEVDVVRMVRKDHGRPTLVIMPQRVALDVAPTWSEWCQWGDGGLTYQARAEEAAARVTWRHNGRPVGESAWIWDAGGRGDGRLMHYGWAGLAEQVVFDDRLVWTCANWMEACGSSVRVEARDRLGFACASLDVWPQREVTRWGVQLQIGFDHIKAPHYADDLDGAMEMCAPLLASSRSCTNMRESSGREPHVNRAQRALRIWEGSHVLYHSPTHGAPFEEIWADDFEQMLLDWWRGDDAREYHKER